MQKRVPFWFVAFLLGLLVLSNRADNEREIERQARRRAGMYIDAIEEQERRLNAE